MYLLWVIDHHNTGLILYRYVLGIDIDEDALDIFQTNVEEFEICNIDLMMADVLSLPESYKNKFDTVVMNPPFGTKHNKGTRTKFFCIMLPTFQLVLIQF